MAERKSGPVKPPVIDLTARPADKPSDAPKAAEKPAGAAKPASPGRPDAGQPGPKSTGPLPPEAAKPTIAEKPAAPAPSPPRRTAWGAALGGGIGGAVVAIAVCYGLAYEGLWPAGSASESRFAGIEARLAQNEKASADGAAAAADAGTRLGTLQTDFAAKLGAASSTLEAMQGSLAKVQAGSAAVDLKPLQTQVAALSVRLDAVAAGASSADAGALAANVATVQQNFADLAQKVAALGDRIGAGEGAVKDLKGELDGAKAAIDQAAAAPSPKAIASAMQLPLLISALDADFGTGRPYAGDLDALTKTVPETHVPAGVSDAAASGLPAPEELVQAFEAKMPDLIAALPASTDASWQGQVGDWVRGVLAIRPAAEQAGDSPAALLSRAEAAVNRRDFAGAAALLEKLPEPMRQAAGDVAGKIKTLADAQGFVAGLRQRALAPAAGVQQ